MSDALPRRRVTYCGKGVLGEQRDRQIPSDLETLLGRTNRIFSGESLKRKTAVEGAEARRGQPRRVGIGIPLKEKKEKN